MRAKLRLSAIVLICASPFLAGCHNRSSSTHLRPPDPNFAFFSDITARAGIQYAWSIPGKRPLNILQTIGNGCAFLDFNNDGNLDILLVGPAPALYTGDGKGHFTDRSGEVGLTQLTGHFLGCAVGDYDNDGSPDIYLTAFRGGALLHNESGHRLKQVPLAGQPWGTSAAFVETVSGSGRLDLVVANYARFGNEPGIDQLCEEKGASGKPVLTSCGPRHYKPIKAVVYRNLGQKFAPPEQLSMVDGRGLGVAACDFDDTGRQAVAFANDETAGNLLHNLGRGKFKDIGALSGTAYDRDGNVHGGMGIDWGDYDNDGRFDFFVSTFRNEPKSLYHNEGRGLFADMGYPSGIASPTFANVGFGCKFIDFDNDGWLDLVIANGHVQDNISEIDSAAAYRQSLQLFRNKGASGGGRVSFEQLSGMAGQALAKNIVGRGLAAGDYDNDGRVDLLVVDSEGTPMLLHNEVTNSNHWLGIRLIGTRSNRDGYGAILTIRCGARKLTRHCHSDGSYMSSSDRRVHFGLGEETVIDELMIRWPSGKTDRLKSFPVDRYVTVREGHVIPSNASAESR